MGKFYKVLAVLLIVAVLAKLITLSIPIILSVNSPLIEMDWEVIQVFLDKNFSNFIAFFALIVSFASYIQTKRQAEIMKAELDDVLSEKASHRFGIVPTEFAKQEGEDGLQVWAVKLIVSNKGDEAVFLNKLEIDLHFKLFLFKKYTKFIRLLFNLPTIVTISLNLYESGVGYGFKGDPEILAKVTNVAFSHSDPLIYDNAFLFNWEDKQPIRFQSRQEYRCPDPQEKQIWILFGKFPFSLAKRLSKAGFYLDSIECVFHTDKEQIKISGNFALSQSVSKNFLATLEELSNIFKDSSLI